MAVVFLALGSNVGDSDRYIESAAEQLQQQMTDFRQAPRYRSKAVGFTEQSDFVNTAVMGVTMLSPRELLDFVKQIEVEVGRIQRFRWGPREIDIDIIFYDDIIVYEPRLHIPHARLAERDFVLKPLVDLAPDKLDPRSGLTVRQLYELLPPSEHAIK